MSEKKKLFCKITCSFCLSKTHNSEFHYRNSASSNCWKNCFLMLICLPNKHFLITFTLYRTLCQLTISKFNWLFLFILGLLPKWIHIELKREASDGPQRFKQWIKKIAKDRRSRTGERTLSLKSGVEVGESDEQTEAEQWLCECGNHSSKQESCSSAAVSVFSNWVQFRRCFQIKLEVIRCLLRLFKIIRIISK